MDVERRVLIANNIGRIGFGVARLCIGDISAIGDIAYSIRAIDFIQLGSSVWDQISQRGFSSSDSYTSGEASSTSNESYEGYIQPSSISQGPHPTELILQNYNTNIEAILQNYSRQTSEAQSRYETFLRQAANQTEPQNSSTIVGAHSAKFETIQRQNTEARSQYDSFLQTYTSQAVGSQNPNAAEYDQIRQSNLLHASNLAASQRSSSIGVMVSQNYGSPDPELLEAAEMSSLFALIDVDRNGWISYDELFRFIYTHLDVTRDEISSFFQACDKNRNDRIEFHELYTQLKCYPSIYANFKAIEKIVAEEFNLAVIASPPGSSFEVLGEMMQRAFRRRKRGEYFSYKGNGDLWNRGCVPMKKDLDAYFCGRKLGANNIPLAIENINLRLGNGKHCSRNELAQCPDCTGLTDEVVLTLHRPEVNFCRKNSSHRLYLQGTPNGGKYKNGFSCDICRLKFPKGSVRWYCVFCGESDYCLKCIPNTSQFKVPKMLFCQSGHEMEITNCKDGYICDVCKTSYSSVNAWVCHECDWGICFDCEGISDALFSGYGGR